MERSEDIDATIIRIMKSMDRSNAVLSTSIGCFENPHAFVEMARVAHSSLPASASTRKRVALSTKVRRRFAEHG